jgi:hypothetical protein
LLVFIRYFSSHAFITGELASIQYRLIEYGDGVPQVIG